MKSIPFLDNRYRVRTLFSDNEDWRSIEGWQHADTRNAALRDFLHVPLKRILYASEVHSGNVLVVSDESDSCPDAVDQSGALGLTGECDALVTAVSGVMLCIWTADCLPLFLYDPVANVAAIAHCGWRGICDGIVSNAVGVMARNFGVSPENVSAAFGPCICEKCYEVGGELVDAFPRRFPADETGDIFTLKQNGKYLLDLKKATVFELLRMGVQLEEIHDVGICSYESEDYSSYRRSGSSDFGRMTLSGIVLT